MIFEWLFNGGYPSLPHHKIYDFCLKHGHSGIGWVYENDIIKMSAIEDAFGWFDYVYIERYKDMRYVYHAEKWEDGISKAKAREISDYIDSLIR